MSERPDIVLQNGAATLTFFWTQDRYQHRFERPGAKVESTDLDSSECPVFTDLHQQGELLFASGNAGIGHWSASIEPSSTGFLFDVAIRLGRKTESLASAYAAPDLIESGTFSAADDSAAVTVARSLAIISPAAEIRAPVCTVHYKYLLS